MNMDKNKAKQQVLYLISDNFPKLQEELVEIKKTVDPYEQQKKADSSYNKHYYHSLTINGLISRYNLLDNGGQGAQEYNKLVNELYSLKSEALKKVSSITCAYSLCQKRHLTNPYVHDNMGGYLTVFCNQEFCFSKWNEKMNEYTCGRCNQTKTGQYWIIK